MTDSLRFCLLRLRAIQKEFKEKALSDVLEPRVRAAYFDAEGKSSQGLGELDYLLNIGHK